MPNLVAQWCQWCQWSFPGEPNSWKLEHWSRLKHLGPPSFLGPCSMCHRAAWHQWAKVCILTHNLCIDSIQIKQKLQSQSRFQPLKKNIEKSYSIKISFWFWWQQIKTRPQGKKLPGEPQPLPAQSSSRSAQALTFFWGPNQAFHGHSLGTQSLLSLPYEMYVYKSMYCAYFIIHLL